MNEQKEVAQYIENPDIKNSINKFLLLSRLSPLVVYLIFFVIIITTEGNGIIGAILLALLWGTITNFLLERIIYTPVRIVKFRNISKNMMESLPTISLTPTQAYQRSRPTPGLIAIDKGQRKIIIQDNATDYAQLILHAEQIIGAKVERETEITTTTKLGGRVSIFSKSGFGYTFGGKSKSSSKVTEYAFLEIHYQTTPDSAPTWIAIPFGIDRREADSMLVAIEQIRGNL